MAEEDTENSLYSANRRERPHPATSRLRQLADSVSALFRHEGSIRLDSTTPPQTLARFRPLGGSPYRGRRRWDQRFLYVSWITHFGFLSLVTLGLVTSFMTYVRLRYISWTWILVVVLTAVVEFVEIHLYSRKGHRGINADSLQPAIFLAAQVSKSFLWTWMQLDAIRAIPAWLAHPSIVYAFWSFVHFGILLSYYTSLGYAVLIFIRERRLQRIYDPPIIYDSAASEESALDTHHIESTKPSFIVNQACDLQDTTPPFGRLILWLDRADRSRTLWSYLVYFAKYSIVAISGIFLILGSERSPGEPKGKFETIRVNYPKPAIVPRAAYSDELDEPQTLIRQSSTDMEASRSPDLRPSASATSLRSVTGLIQANSSRISSPRPGQGKPLGPRYLCFLDEDKPRGYKMMHFTQWDRGRSGAGASYVFVSYTRRQFYSQIRNDPSLTSDDINAHREVSERHQAHLIGFAIKSAKEAGVPAFWIDFECVLPEDEESADDSIQEVYRICDIVRAAHSIAIVLASPLDENFEHETDNDVSAKDEWLRDWGRRLWTVPEALLAPSEHRIMVYALGEEQPEKIAKRNFAGIVYDDAEQMQQLIDHYEGSVPLTPLQFISLALECLHRRQTVKRMAGDVSYALQGLLRLRPDVNKSHSDFQAFAQLSLANDSDRLLERLICLYPTTPDAPWYDMSDAWDARLWNIVPTCEVAAVLNESTVSLGSMPSASIDWFHLEIVDFETSKRFHAAVWQSLRSSSPVFWLMTLFIPLFRMIMPSRRKETDVDREADLIIWITFGIVWVSALAIALVSPALVIRILKRKIWSSEARFFGVQGIPDLDEVERRIFGSSNQRMKWASPDPGHGSIGDEQMFLFTLIDTFTLTAVQFRSKRPPAVVAVCGRERGMARALLCSYDWSNRSFVQETTIRMQAAVCERMDRLESFPLAIIR